MLLQTLVMSIILSFISISITRWVLNRYRIATRSANNTIAKGITEGGSMLFFMQWNTNTMPTPPTVSANGKPVTFRSSSITSGGVTIERVSADYDQ